MRNPEAIAWTVAAEGEISLMRTNHGRGIAAVVCVYNTDKTFLEQFQKMCGGIGAIYTRGKAKPGNKQSHEWTINSFGICLDFLCEIVDYLPIKQECAEIVINFCLRAIEQKRHLSLGPYRPKPQQEDWDAVDRIRELNMKGVPIQ